jgi:hypothetical protein
MSKSAIVSGLTALLLAAPSLALAQTEPAQQQQQQQMQPPAQMQQPQGMQQQGTSEMQTLTDERIDVIKFALQLKPDQEQFWPPIEEAIRARAEMRRQHLQDIITRVKNMRQGDAEFNPVKALQERANTLSQRATGLKQLADAWQPLYETLDDRQRLRMRVLAVSVLRDMREAIENRHMMIEEEDMSMRGAVGAGSGETGMGRE